MRGSGSTADRRDPFVNVTTVSTQVATATFGIAQSESQRWSSVKNKTTFGRSVVAGGGDGGGGGSGATTVNRTHGIDASNFRLASPARNPTVYAPIGTESEYVHVVARAPGVASVARSHMLVGPTTRWAGATGRWSGS